MRNSKAVLQAGLVLVACGCLGLAASHLRRIKITDIKNYSGSAALPKPASIAVYNFAITPDEIKLNSAVLHRIKERADGASADDEKTKLAREIVDSFSAALVKELQKTGLPVNRVAPGEPQADDALAIQGDFQTVDEGNRTRRVIVGLGRGASEVKSHVACFIKQAESNVVLTEFEASSKSSRKPGAAETAGVSGAAATSVAVAGATELKQDAEGDANRMAKEIAKQIMKSMGAQGWVRASAGL